MVSKIWGRNGLDGDFEAREASRGAGPLKNLTLLNYTTTITLHLLLN